MRFLTFLLTSLEIRELIAADSRLNLIVQERAGAGLTLMMFDENIGFGH